MMRLPTPRSNGSPEGDAFVAFWGRIVLEDRNRERERRRTLAKIGVTKVIPNDGWVDRENGVPVRIPTDHPYGEYRSLAIGERVAIGAVGSDRETSVAIYQAVSIRRGMLPGCDRARISWVRDVPW